jgi:hypothetical protein
MRCKSRENCLEKKEVLKWFVFNGLMFASFNSSCFGTAFAIQLAITGFYFWRQKSKANKLLNL